MIAQKPAILTLKNLEGFEDCCLGVVDGGFSNDENKNKNFPTINRP
jgi:hypothetical protein